MASSSASSAGNGLGNGTYPVTLVRKVRKLPLPGEVLVKQGDEVTPDTEVARISLKPGIPWVIPAARLLGIEPADLPAAMLRKVGDRVKTKEIIARAQKGGLYGQKEYESPTDGVIEDISAKSGRLVIREEFGKEEPPVSFDACFELGCRPKDLPKFMLRNIGDEVKRGQIVAKKGEAQAFFTKTARAPITGIVSEFNEQTGYITISRPFKQVVVKGYIHGRVAELIQHRGCIVESPAVRVSGIFGLGREAYGQLVVLADKPSDRLTHDMITPEHAGKIVVGGSFATDEALARALEVGCRGVITGTASYINLINSLGVKLGVGITGQEEIDLTVILMEGFGELSMREKAFLTLKALDGKMASINGATQIRAGAIRPEVIVTFPDFAGEPADERVVDEELSRGQRVRIINDPYFGQLAAVKSLPKEPVVVSSGAKVPVVEVELEGGGTVLIPRANVEIF